MHNLDFVLGMRLIAATPAHYQRDVLWSVGGTNHTLLSPNVLTVNVNNVGYYLQSQIGIDLSQAASWDSQAPTDYTQAANRAGKNFYIYACRPATGMAPKIVISANSTVPTGYTASNSRKVGGFHCLCVAVGVISGHPLSGFVAGDIIPASIWDLNHQPKSGPEGMVYCAAAGVWVDIYLQGGTGSSTASVYGGTVVATRNWMDFVDDLGAVNKQMLTDVEFQLAATGGNEGTNIAGSTNPVTTGGHNDTAGRRMISNIGCEDCAGAFYQWLNEQSYRYDPDASVQDGGSSYAATVYYQAAPGGAPVYLKFTPAATPGNPDVPYLCSNITGAVDRVVSFGTLRLTVVYDANASTGYPIYINSSGTEPTMAYANIVNYTQNCYIQTNNPGFQLQIAHSTTASNYKQLYWNDSTSHFECTTASAANVNWDLAMDAPGFSWYVLPGSKGQLYKQGVYGDVKLLAGMAWSAGSDCGSRCRSAAYYRWSANAAVGCRGRAEPAV
jgi:hypothetical protein